MADKICIRMPFLRGGSYTGQWRFPLARNLCPGIPQEKRSPPRQGNYWQPENYPFNPQEAWKIVCQFRNLDERDLPAMLNSLQGNAMADDLRQRDELAAISRFAGDSNLSDDNETRFALVREQAQKNLLWLWLQEEILAQISAIADKCARVEASLADCFTEIPPQKREPKSFAAELAPDLSLLPSWKVCLANAAIFVPAQIPFFVEGQMANDLAEIMEFENAPQYAGFLGCEPAESDGIGIARASVASVLGYKNGRAAGSLGNVYGQERTWIIWNVT